MGSDCFSSYSLHIFFTFKSMNFIIFILFHVSLYAENHLFNINANKNESFYLSGYEFCDKMPSINSPIRSYPDVIIIAHDTSASHPSTSTVWT